MLQKMTKTEVIQHVKKEGSWRGYIAPSKVNPSHVNGSWHIGVSINIVKEGLGYYIPSNGQLVELSSFIDHYKIYNCNQELGLGVSFWK